MSRLPEYDPKRDGSPFPWILRAAAEVRERRRQQHAREYVQVLERRLRYLPKRED